MKTYDYNELLKDELKKPKFRKEYEALQEEFDVARQVIELRLQKGLTQNALARKVHTTQSCAVNQIMATFCSKIG